MKGEVAHISDMNMRIVKDNPGQDRLFRTPCAGLARSYGEAQAR
jgi:hypothetical protein